MVLLTERDDLRDRQDTLAHDRQVIEKKLQQLTSPVENGHGDIVSFVVRIRELQELLKDIDEEIAGLRPVPRLAPKVLDDRLSEWRRLLRGSVTQGRSVIQPIVKGRITFMPRADGGYDFTADTRFDKFAGVVVERPAFIPDGGATYRDGSLLETLDADYGQLLATALNAVVDGHKGNKGVCARRESHPKQGSSVAGLILKVA